MNNRVVLHSRFDNVGFILLLILFALIPSRVLSTEVIEFEDDWKSGWSVTALHGWFTDDGTITQTVTFNTDLDTDFKFAGIAVNKRLFTLWSYLEFEGEFQAIKHYGDQNHGEFVGLGAMRWRKFPWDRWLQTGVAVGAGISLATEDPAFEIMHKDSTSDVLAYLLVEVELGLRKYPNWTVVGRVHHRSTAFDLFTKNHAASNAYAIGLKYRFE